MITLIKKLTLPILFIFLYGSGFVFTALGLQNSSPIAFLTLRFFIAFFIFSQSKVTIAQFLLTTLKIAIQ